MNRNKTMSEKEINERPPVSLPNGKRNPEYSRWYYWKNRGKLSEWRKKYYEENKEKIIAINKRSRATPEGQKALKRYQASDKAKECGKRYRSKRVCAFCGITYRLSDCKERGYKMIGRNKCVCDLCS